MNFKHVVLTLTLISATSLTVSAGEPTIPGVSKCTLDTLAAEKLVDSTGNVDDEEVYLTAATKALNTCKEMPYSRKVAKLYDAGEAVCNEQADQRSMLFLGMCKLKLINFVSSATGQ